MNTDKIIKELRELKRSPDDDNIRIKNIIKKKILQNEKIVYVLNDKELLDKDTPIDEYYGHNILPYYIIPNTQTKIKNFLCYETSTNSISKNNEIIKIQQIIFYCLCHVDNITEVETGLPRHDLLSALILDEFNWTNDFGTTLHCISNVGGVLDTDYALRTLKFEMESLSNIVRTKNGITKVINKEINL